MQGPLLLLCCATVAGWDLWARRVPNRLLIVFLAMQCALMAHSPSAIGWQSGLTGMGIGFVALLPFYALRLMGAGDVKFAAVLGLMTGPQVFFWSWVGAGLLAGIHGLLVFYARSNLSMSAIGGWIIQTAWWQRIAAGRRGRHGIPYAAYLAAGAVAVMLIFHGTQVRSVLNRMVSA